MVLQYLTSLVEEGNTVHKHICVVDWAYHLNLPTSLLYSNEDAHTTDKNVKISEYKQFANECLDIFQFRKILKR